MADHAQLAGKYGFTMHGYLTFNHCRPLRGSRPVKSEACQSRSPTRHGRGVTNRIDVGRRAVVGLSLGAMQQRKLYFALALAGATPFVACAILPLLGFSTIEPFGRLQDVASSYGLGIITFIAGTHWATDLYKQSSLPLSLFASSNVVFLAVWITFVVADIGVVLATQVVAFLLLLFIDYRLFKSGTISDHYFRTRSIATSVASVSLLVLLFSGA